MAFPVQQERGNQVGSRSRFTILKLPLFLFPLFVFVPGNSFNLSCPLLMMFFVSLDGFVDKITAIPNFSLVNQQSLDKILKAEVFVHIDRQLKATHLILDYIPISKSFQALRCVFKERDPRLHRISVATPGFLTTSPIPKGVLTTGPILEGIPKVELPSQHAAEEEASSSQLLTKGEEGVVEVFDSKDFEDDFEVFDQPLSPETPSGDLGHSLLA